MTQKNGICETVLDCVGQTPCVRLQRIPQRHGLACDVVAKCEFMNPGGSVKDRIGKEMLLEAERSGRLKPGSIIVEASSGNTGIGLSMAAAVKGYPMVVTMPKKMSHEKEATLLALGTEVIRTETALPWDDPNSLIGVARRLEREKGYVFLDQYSNPGNPAAHFSHTAQEIYDQCGGAVDMVVIASGTGGTITGVAKRLKELLPNIVVVGVDPVGSVLAGTDDGPAGPYHVEGIGYDFLPAVFDGKYVDRWVKTRDPESFALASEIHREEGLLVGGSSGSAMAGVLEAAKDLRSDQRCVVLFADSIRNYLGKFVDRNWMIEHGFASGEITRPTYDMLQREVAELKAKVAALEKTRADKAH